MRFKVDWAILVVGSKFSVFALFYFVFEGNCPSTSPREAYIWRGDLTEGFLSYRFGGLIHHGGAYFRNFTVCGLLEETSAPPPKKNPGSAPGCSHFITKILPTKTHSDFFVLHVPTKTRHFIRPKS